MDLGRLREAKRIVLLVSKQNAGQKLNLDRLIFYRCTSFGLERRFGAVEWRQIHVSENFTIPLIFCTYQQGGNEATTALSTFRPKQFLSGIADEKGVIHVDGEI